MTQPHIPDTLYAAPLQHIADFAFDASVAAVFPDMIQRSVPGYSTIIAHTGLLAARFAQPQSTLYDLGCSLGASTLAMAQQLRHIDCRIVAVDNSPAMLERCAEILQHQMPDAHIEQACSDIQDIVIERASVVVMNFTLQFIPPDSRPALLQRIHDGMLPGAVLILSEKVCFDDPQLNTLNIDLHHAFKRANGYSELEISQKRSALENVLLPETIDTHRQRLLACGFRSVDVWFQCFNFMSMVAIK